MLRINSCADAGYYLGSVNERESALEWSGLLARELGIGSLDHAALKTLLANRTPEGERLTPHDHPDRREGYDLTFSEPKSVSIMEQVVGDKRIGQARRDSVAEVMALLVEPRAATRRWNGKHNELIAAGNLAYLAFDHLLARPENGMPDPNGHTHVVVANATEWEGRRTALEVRPIKEAAPFIEAAWHALFAEKLKGLGYDIRPTQTAFEIEGVSDAVIRKFSTRTVAVEGALERRGQTLDEQIRGAASPAELRLLEGRVARLKSPKGKAALGAQIREKKLPALSPEAIDRDWMERLTIVEQMDLQDIRNRAVYGEPATDASQPGRVFAPLRELLAPKQDKSQEPVAEGKPMLPFAPLRDLLNGPTPAGPGASEPGPPDRAFSHLKASLGTLLQTDSRLSEERLLTHALKAGVGEVTLLGLLEMLHSDRFQDATDLVAANGQVSTLPMMAAEAEVLSYARAGQLHWVKDKVEGLPDAGKLSFPELHQLVREAGEKHLVITGDAKGQRDGQPLRLLRDHAYMKPIGEPERPKKPTVVKPAVAKVAAIKPLLKGWKERMKRFVLKAITQREVQDVRPERSAERGIER